MKQLLVEIEDDDARRLEQVAPARSRKRSEFIRSAIRRALWEIEERATRKAYKRYPDSAQAYLDPIVWEFRSPAAPKYKTKRKRR